MITVEIDVGCFKCRTKIYKLRFNQLYIYEIARGLNSRSCNRYFVLEDIKDSFCSGILLEVYRSDARAMIRNIVGETKIAINTSPCDALGTYAIFSGFPAAPDA